MKKIFLGAAALVVAVIGAAFIADKLGWLDR
jgi:hypothetical protein